MARKELVPRVDTPQEIPGINLREMRRSLLMEGGLLKPRQRYESKEERKVAARERAKERRETRKSYLEEKGVSPAARKAKLTKAEKKVKSKTLRKYRNIYLREHPEEAKKLGIDLGRLRV